MPDEVHDGLAAVPQFQDLPDDVWDEVLAVCERFDQDWTPQAKIEHYLDQAAGEARRFRLLKLLEIDLEKREQAGETSRGRDYLARFPGEANLVLAAFQAAGLSSDARTPSAHGAQTAPGHWPSAAWSRPSPSAEGLPSIEGYEFLRQIGQGGMGVVFQARQKKPERIVAVKMIKAGYAASPEARRRFDIEVQCAGRLRHPNIVALHACGEAGGQPYFTMDYIPGRNLDVVRRDPVAPRRAAQYVKTIALAIQYAHDQGLLHRDLKPSNILIDEADEPYVTDFGLAKTLTADEHGITATGEVLGTLGYMPPEQAEGVREQLDRRSDVYSLGAILYCLLTGRPPFSAANRVQLIRQVLHDEPVAPRRLSPDLPRDLETICLKCLAKTPARRYDTARDLAEDLARFLAGETIRARPAGVVERTVRWSRRNKWQAAAAGLAFVAFILAVGLSISRSLAAHREYQLRTRTESLLRLAEARQAKYQYQVAMQAFGARDMQAAQHALAALPASQRGLETKLLERRLLDQPQLQTALVDDYFGILAAVVSPDGQRLVAAYATGSVLVWDLASGRVCGRPCVGRWDDARRRRLFHSEDRPDQSQPIDWGPCYTALAWLPGGMHVAGVALDGTVVVFDVARGSVRTVCQVGEPLSAVASSGDGADVLCGGSSGQLYSVSTAHAGRPKVLDGASAVTALLALPDRRHCLLGRADGTLQLVAVPALAIRAAVQGTGGIWGLDATAKDRGWLVAAAGESPQLALWQIPGDASAIEPGPALATPDSAARPVVYQAVRFGPQGERLYALDSRGILTRWDVATKGIDWTLQAVVANPSLAQRDQDARQQGLADGLPAPLRRVAALVCERPAGNELLTAGGDGAVRLWRLNAVREAGGRRLATHAGTSPRICFDPNQPGWLWTLDRSGQLQVIDCHADRVLAAKPAHAGGAAEVVRLGTAGPLVTVGEDRSVRFWRIDRRRILPARQDLRHDQPLMSVTASPDGRWIAAVDTMARLVVWDDAAGRQIFLTALTEPTADDNGPRLRPSIGCVEFNRDGSFLSAFGAGQTACLFATSPFRRLPEQIWVAGTGGTAMIWSPVDAASLIAADDYPRYKLQTLNEERIHLENDQHFRPESTCVAMDKTPDGRRVVLAERQGVLGFLDAERFIELVRLRSEFRNVVDLAIAPQGNCLAVAAADGALEIWEVAATANAPPRPIEDRADAWESAWLVAPTARVINGDGRMVQLDAHGRVGLLYLESLPRDASTDGRLVFVEETAGGAIRQQPLEVGDSTSARRARADAASLIFGPTGQPMVVFRLRTATLDTSYDGAVYLGQRTTADEWQFQAIHRHGNLGFWPALRLDREGQPAELLHFSYERYGLVRSVPGDRDEAEWNVEPIGQQGDGLGFVGELGPNGDWHLVFKVNRFNEDPAPRVFARWDGRTLGREIIDPLQPLASSQFALAPDGSPVVRVGRKLVRRTPAGWTDYATLPFPETPTFRTPQGEVRVDREGNVFCVEWDVGRQRPVLWKCRQGQWSGEAVPAFREGSPNLCTLRLSPQGRPVLVLGCVGEPNGWLRVLREKE